MGSGSALGLRGLLLGVDELLRLAATLGEPPAGEPSCGGSFSSLLLRPFRVAACLLSFEATESALVRLLPPPLCDLLCCALTDRLLLDRPDCSEPAVNRWAR